MTPATATAHTSNTLSTLAEYRTAKRQLTAQLGSSVFFRTGGGSVETAYYHYYFHSQPDAPLEQEHQSIIAALRQLALTTNTGKLICNSPDIVQLLVAIATRSSAHLQSIHPKLISANLLLLQNSSSIQSQHPQYLRLPISPHSQIISHATALLTQISKFSSPQLSTHQVKLIIHLFINSIGLTTHFEHHLKIVLDYIDCLITFGYVPTHPSPSPDQPDHPLLDGPALLIDLVRFVAKIVGLQGLKATVNVVRTLEPKQHSDLIDLSSSGQSILTYTQ